MKCHQPTTINMIFTRDSFMFISNCNCVPLKLHEFTVQMFDSIFHICTQNDYVKFTQYSEYRRFVCIQLFVINMSTLMVPISYYLSTILIRCTYQLPEPTMQTLTLSLSPIFVICFVFAKEFSFVHL